MSVALGRMFQIREHELASLYAILNTTIIGFSPFFLLYPLRLALRLHHIEYQLAQVLLTAHQQRKWSTVACTHPRNLNVLFSDISCCCREIEKS